MKHAHSRKLFAEFIGTAFLLATVVGSGIMAERIAAGNTAIALLGNTIPTGAILVVLIVVFGPVSIGFILSLIYILVQILGGLTGVWSAHYMFEEELIQFSLKERTGSAQ